MLRKSPTEPRRRKVLLAGLFFVAVAVPAFAKEGKWYLLAREDGCLPIDKLSRSEKLSKVPASPQEYAEMMRERGFHVVVGLPERFPKELEGKVVRVKVKEDVAPVFVREEICRKFGKRPE